ncbi:proprotein convertase P-domain-containing protein [Streptomyces hydrogenans]|uniref:proprotein convertase P-domain-containing protein n=1 Tax=Streptomyces hydrogenans TaxID=1873719 RepID=UPI003684D639
MKRPTWALVTAVSAALLFTAIPAPAHSAAPSDDPVPSADRTGPVDPPLFDATQDGSTIRVNVVTDQRTDLAAATQAGETLVSYDALPLVTLRVDNAGLTELATALGVVSVTEDIPAPPTLDQSTAVIGSDTITAAGMTGVGSTIAVLDTGVSAGHPFLSGRVTAEACFSVNDPAIGATSLCPGGGTEEEGSGTADTDAGPCAAMAASVCAHGTHVAGIVAGDGTGTSGAPAHGVAPGAHIAAIQVFTKFDNDKYCGAGASPCVLSYASSQAKGLEKVLALKKAGTPVVAANLSLGAGRHTSACDSDPRKALIDNLLAEGVATVIAAGNNSFADAVSNPGCVSTAVTVGSTTDDDQLSTFSNRGPLLDLLAPGTGIVSSLPGRTYGSKNGTSMAAPHVAGALAVLKQTHPSEEIDGLVSRLVSSGAPVTYTGATTPRLDVQAAAGDLTPEPGDGSGKPVALRFSNDVPVVIPDSAGTNVPGTPAHSPITVTRHPEGAPKDLSVKVSYSHAWIGDVRLELVSPTGRTYLLKSANLNTGGTTYTNTFTVDATGQPSDGEWRVRATDIDNGSTGSLNTWSLHFPTPFRSTTVTTIPDTGTASSALAISGVAGYASGPSQVYVDLTHTRIGDLSLTLTSPDNKTFTLKPHGSEPGEALKTTYGVDATTAKATGTWTLKVTDSAGGSTGQLNAWSLGFPSYENQTVKQIPDDDYEQIWTTVTGLTGTGSARTQVYVHVEHANLANLKIDLVAPDGSLFLLKGSGSPEEGGVIKKTYTVDTSGKSANGMWKLRVDDVMPGNTGTVHNFVLRF